MRVHELHNDPNWKPKILDGEGLKPIGKDFSPYNVKFLMLEMHLKRTKLVFLINETLRLSKNIGKMVK